MKPDRNNFAFTQIGIIRTCFEGKESAPVQGVFTGGARGTVEVFEEYEEGLKDVECFSHICLFYIFDKAGEIRMVRKPFLDDTPRGLFSTRHPCRPNPLGMTVVRLCGRSGRVLDVEGIDVLDGTPLVDLKPYVKRFDCFPDSVDGWLENIEEREKPAGRE